MIKASHAWLPLLFAALLSPLGRATAIFTVFESGGNVVAIGSGSLDLTDLTLAGNGPQPTEITSNIAFLVVGLAGTVNVYSGATGPSAFGTGGFTSGSGSGAQAGIFGAVGEVYVASSYVSGTVFSDTATWSSTTLAGLGLAPGSYRYTWGSGPDTDSLTVNVVPEPGSFVLLTLGLAGLTGARRLGHLYRS